MGTVEMMIAIHMKALVFFLCLFLPSLPKHLLSCETPSPHVSSYHCIENLSHNQCATFALFLTNSYYSSLSNLTTYLGLNKFLLAQANGFSADTDFLSHHQPLLIPIHCKCKAGFSHAHLTKTAIKGESFYDIAQSLEGLTTCKAIRDNNPGVSPWNLDDRVRLIIPLRCSCPFSSQLTPQPKFLLSYPVTQGDTISSLASKFNITQQAIVSANHISSSQGFTPGTSLPPFTSILIPLNAKPVIGPLLKPKEPNSGFQPTSIPVKSPHNKSPMWKTELFIGLAGVALGVCIALAAAFFFIRLKHKKGDGSSCKEGDMELQHLNQSVRTTSTSDKKVSFEGSQDTLDVKIVDATSRKMLLETYTIENIRKATEDFSSSNHIEGSVYHGRLNGKNMAVKRTKAETVLKIDLGLFHDALHHHPNILRLLGTSVAEGKEQEESFLVFEYAKNGSLKDWLHGGLAIKNQFIASCYCFLTWSQRLRICLDVASALQYMHHVMNPCYVHRNVKSRNIFLDEEFGAKLGNFGTADCVEHDTEDPHFYSTNPASWSLGYLAPEYVHQGIIAPSIDIFAYGVVLLEVLSGQTPISRPNEKGEGSIWLTDKIKSILVSENVNELRGWIDSALGENYSFDAAVSIVNIARACVEEDSCLRPSAREIVEKLSRLVEELPEGEQHMLMSESSSKPLVKAVENSLE
ncbi:protein LYK2 [Vigna unguiculata]|uniref:Chitin elicitor receptor kinase 1 n=1 Tax=Vigna unguiculata TaxID=3917 RepID=A0A4D6M617_VIGUN|nr:protein LYK2 [Vigna unguiculata]QCD96675.1 chitin elicitor receptor kinase 1 [Vigna unguiculata]